MKAAEATFSNKDYFKTVFISGDDMVKEEAAMKQKEIDDFKKQVVVDNLHFKVNTMEKQKVVQLDRFKNIREDEVKKIGFRHKKKRLAQLVGRQIMGTKTIEDAPVSMLKEEEYKRLGYRAPFKEWDPVKSVGKDDLVTAIHPNARIKSPASKTFIQPVTEAEKTGPKWGRPSAVN